MQRIANRIRVFLALGGGEPLCAIVHWTGLSRTALWYLWQRYKQRGVEAVYDASGAPAPSFFPPLDRVRIEPTACTDPSAFGLEMTHCDVRSLQQVVLGQEVVTSIHYTAVFAGILAAASLQPHRYRYWKTAHLDETFTERAAKIL